LRRRKRLVAFAAAALVTAGGCALWNKELWNPNHYRDERAVDIDNRLEKNVPLVKNPF
jgi:hypothetical protein